MISPQRDRKIVALFSSFDIDRFWREKYWSNLYLDVSGMKNSH